MELPNVGKQCAVDSCRQLDFLPYKCSGCQKVFCQDHWKLKEHGCPNEIDITENRIVPTCPLCNTVVPISRGQDPNIRMDEHIRKGCADPGKSASKPIYTNACKVAGCKKKEVVPFNCKDCKLNFCVHHRLPVDHDCTPKQLTAYEQMKGWVNGSSSSTNRNQTAKKFKAGRVRDLLITRINLMIRQLRILSSQKRLISLKKHSTGIPQTRDTRRPSDPAADHGDIQLYIPKSLENQHVSISEPHSEPPKWMLKYFPAFFQKDPIESMGPEEHNQPMGESGVYGYIATTVITFGLSCALIYELFFTDNHAKTKAALREQEIRKKMQELQRMREDEEMRRKSVLSSK